VVVLAEEEVAAASVHFLLVVRLALELAISRDKMTVRQALETERIAFQINPPAYFLGAFLLACKCWRTLLGLGSERFHQVFMGFNSRSANQINTIGNRRHHCIKTLANGLGLTGQVDD